MHFDKHDSLGVTLVAIYTLLMLSSNYRYIYLYVIVTYSSYQVFDAGISSDRTARQLRHSVSMNSNPDAGLFKLYHISNFCSRIDPNLVMMNIIVQQKYWKLPLQLSDLTGMWMF